MRKEFKCENLFDETDSIFLNDAFNSFGIYHKEKKSPLLNVTNFSKLFKNEFQLKEHKTNRN